MTDVAMADNPGAPPAAEKPPPPEYPPNQTIYVNNISEKIKITNLVTELKAIFNQFGNIIEIQVNNCVILFLTSRKTYKSLLP